jgi:copper transport protein
VGLTMFEVLVLRSATEANRARERVLVLATTTTIVAHAVAAPLTLLRGQALGLDRLFDESLLAASLGTAPALALALVVLGCSLLVLRPVLPGSRSRTVISSLGATLAVSSVLPVGHTRTAVPTSVVMMADLVHALAGAIWFGGVIGLALFLGAARRAGAPAAGAAGVVRRFSGLAGMLVAALGVSGVILGVLILGSARSLLGTDYGRTLLVKLALVAVVGLLAWWNKTHLVPAVERQLAPREQWRRLTGAVRDEVALLVAVICVTGLLVMQSPHADQDPGPPPAGESTFRAALGEGAVQGSITPARLGVNVIEFAVRDGDGAAVAPSETPTVTATLPDQGLGPVVAAVRPTGAPGRYRAQITLPAPGRWQLAVSVPVDEFTRPAARLTVAVAP